MTGKCKSTLAALVDHYSGEGMGYLSFDAISEVTKLERRDVRRSCRALRKRGFAKFGKGLFHDDGSMAGAGYAATIEGMAEFEKQRRLNKEGGPCSE